MPRPPVLVRAALSIVRLVGVLVPRRDRTIWRREWEGEIRSTHAASPAGLALETQMAIFRRSLGSFSDAAWLRRQFTRDSEWLHDLHYTLRLMRARPGFFALAALVLTLGIGSTTTVFSVVDAILLRESPFPDAERLVTIWQDDTSRPGNDRGEVAPGNFLAWRAGVSTFDAMATAEPYSMDYTGGDVPEVFYASNVSETFFDLLGVQPLHGRLFTGADHVAGRNRVAVLGFDLWTSRFGADPAIVGRTIPLDSMPFTVVGILPGLELDLLDAPGKHDLWLPKVFQEYEADLRGDGWWAAIGRLKPGVTKEQAQADLNVVSDRLSRDYPSTNATLRAVIEPITEHLVADARPALNLLLGAVLVVLLVACANVANMMLARAADRDRELAIRGALGAGRGRIARQLLNESLLVSMMGAACGLVLASWMVNVVVALAPADIPRLAEASINWRLGLFAAAVGVLAGLVSGLAPAWQYSRPRTPDAIGAGRASTITRGGRLVRDGLAVAEIAMAVSLVLGAGLLLRSFTRLLAVDPGFRTDHVLALQVFAYDRDNADATRRAQFFRDTMADLRALPGVIETGAVSAMPFIEANINISGPFSIEGRPPMREGEQPQANFTAATPGYFSVMRIPLLRGRGLATTDTSGSKPVAVVSESFARRHWPDDDPIGSIVHFRFTGAPVSAEIVGVVGELRHDALDLPPREEVFVPHAQVPFGSMTYVLQTAQDPASVADAAKRVIWRYDPLLTFYDTATVPDLLSKSVAPRRFSLSLVGAFAVMAMLLAGAGIYGVLSFATSRQAREFGVRMAMGATGREIGSLVIGRGLRLGLLGVTLGAALALWAGQSMQAMLFGISPIDPTTFASVALLGIVVTVLACYVPARRAMRVDPIVALRD